MTTNISQKREEASLSTKPADEFGNAQAGVVRPDRYLTCSQPATRTIPGKDEELPVLKDVD